VSALARALAPALVAVAALAHASVAWADAVVEDPVRDACGGKKADDACEVSGNDGACKATKCKRRVGGVLNPHEIEEDCLVCELGATPAKADEPVPAKTEPAKSEPAKSEPAKAASEPSKSSICSVSADVTPLASVALGLVLLALGVSRRARAR
jgi:hypothetical protein